MTETPQHRADDDEPVAIPANDDVEPGSEPEPRNDRDDGAQDDGSDPVDPDEQEQEPVGESDDDEPDDDKRPFDSGDDSGGDE